jgi:hypothetical protein
MRAKKTAMTASTGMYSIIINIGITSYRRLIAKHLPSLFSLTLCPTQCGRRVHVGAHPTQYRAKKGRVARLGPGAGLSGGWDRLSSTSDHVELQIR